MASFVSSDKISVFPSAQRAGYEQSSRLLSEESLINLVNRLLDTDGFVITSSYSSAGNLAFNLHGYYFNVDASALTALFSSSTEIWAYITLSTVGTYAELSGVDENSLYKGVEFYDAEPAISAGDTTHFKLKLLSRASASDTWAIPDESKIKFTSKSIESIDGGTI